MKIIQGDLVEVGADLICQQCNCLTTKPHGLSQYIQETLDICVYSNRRPMRKGRNIAVSEDRSTPGTIEVVKNVVNMMAQFAPGKPGRWYRDITKGRDTSNQRFEWFQDCLLELEQYVVSKHIKSIAFPYKIGCGLAGGDWNVYKSTLEEFEVMMRKHDVDVFLVLKQ